MSDKGIIFSAPMVRALLAGRKTQTRRLFKLPTKTHSGGPIYEHPKMGGWAATTLGGEGVFAIDKVTGQRVSVPERAAIWHQTTGTTIATPHAPGDRLYVRETWKPHSLYAEMKPRDIPVSDVFYAADNRYAPSNTPWVPCIHMPRWASRLWLAVTDVRVERLRDISRVDAIAEGLERHIVGLIPAWRGSADLAPRLYPDLAYGDLWDSLHTELGTRWIDNPWVVATSFTVNLGNIDAGAKPA